MYPKAHAYALKDEILRKSIKPKNESIAWRETQMYRIVKAKEMIMMYNNG